MNKQITNENECLNLIAEYLYSAITRLKEKETNINFDNNFTTYKNNTNNYTNSYNDLPNKINNNSQQLTGLKEIHKHHRDKLYTNYYLNNNGSIINNIEKVL